MTILYDVNYFNKIKKQKNKYLTIYLILLSIVVLALVGIIVYYSLQPYRTSLENPLKISMFAIIILFTLFSGVYLSIVFGRVYKYYKFITHLSSGKKYTFSVTVISINYGDYKSNYGVDFYTIDLLEWSETQNDYVNHRILVDAEFKNLDINEGDMLTITTSLNALMRFKKD